MPQESPSHLVSLFLCGDVMTGRGIDQVLPYPGKPHIYEPYMKSAEGYVILAEEAHGPIERPVSFSYIWGDALGELERIAPDLRIINLETSITKSEEYWEGKGIHYRMHPDNIPCLTAAGIDCCVLANNHVLDWGYPGLIETLASLESAHIKSAGAGRNLQEASSPAVLGVAGKGRVIVLSYGMPSSGIPRSWAASEDKPGVNLLQSLSPHRVRQIQERVATVKQPGDVVVFSVHWGSNWGYEISPRERAFAHQLIDDAGVDLIHGHSSHHVKGIEVYKGRPILYGCGDFLTDYEGIAGYEEYRGDLALMYLASMHPSSGTLADLHMIPLRMRQFRLNRASAADARWLSNVLNREGKWLGTQVTLTQDNTLMLRWAA